MARDVAELLKARVEEVLADVPNLAVKVVGGAPSVWRNRADIPPEECPALILLDGREERIPNTRGRGSMPHATMLWMPQIWIALRERDTPENVGVGPEMSELRVNILKVLKQDAEHGEMGVLMGENGEIEYRGYETDMAIGSDLIGNMVLNFAISYFWDPEDMT
jgi:hypothetical protein